MSATIELQTPSRPLGTRASVHLFIRLVKFQDTPGFMEITELLADVRRGDREALNRLVPLVHNELRRLARNRLRSERIGHTL